MRRSASLSTEFALCALLLAASAARAAEVLPRPKKPQTPPVAHGYPFAHLHPRTLKYPPLQFHPPRVTKKVLPNGLTLYLLEDHELPLFHAVAFINTGSLYEPPDKVGLAALTGQVMRTGGTDTLTGDAIDEALEFVGGHLEVSIGLEYGTVRLSTLQKDAATGMEILAGILRRPAFPEEKLALAKQQMMEQIRRKNDDPGALCLRTFAQAIYGEDSPWAREPTLAGVRALTRQDLIGFHASTVLPQHVHLALCADMTLEAMTDLAQRWLGDWQQPPRPLPTVAPAPQRVTPEVILVPKEVSQANLRLGHLGMRRHSPDQYAVEVMNYILGTGGFASRLMREVRSNRGLAYSVWGLVGKGRDRGLFQVAAETKVESVPETIRVVRRVLEDMTRVPISEKEVESAKEALIRSYVFTFESRASIVGERALRDLLGYPEDYLEAYPQRIAAVTAAQVQRAAKTYLHPNTLVIVAVGPPQQLEKPLAEFGPVRIQPPKPPE